jgi:hypothetical protein
MNVTKAYNSLWACRKAFGATWGRRLHRSINQPSFTIVPLVWPAVRYAGYRLVCLRITMALRIVPTDAMPALTCLPPWFTVQPDRRLIDSRVWGVGRTFTAVEGTAVYWCGFTSWILYTYFVWGTMLWGQHITLNPIIGSLCWLDKSGSEDPGLPLQLRDSSVIIIYLFLTAIGLTPGGSSPVYIYTQTVHRTQRTEHT